MSIIQFELKKLLKLKAFTYFILITILLIAGIFLRNYLYQDIVKAENIEYFQNQSSDVLSQLIADQEDLREIGEGADPTLEESVEVGSLLIKNLQDLLEAIRAEEHLTALEIENEVYKLAMRYQSLPKYYPLSKQDMEDEIKLNEELLNKGLPKEDLTASIQPAVFSKQTVQILVNTFGFLILLMIIGTPIVKEFDDSTIKLTYSLPISSTRMVLSKWMSLVLSGTVWFLLVILSSYAISSIFGKKGTNLYDYPFYTEQMTFISAGDYLQQAILFGLIYILLLSSLFIFISFLLKNTLVVQIISLLLFFVNFIVVRSGYVYPFLPWSYQELDAALLQNEVTSWIGATLSLIITLILLLLAIKASKRREYQS